MFIALNQNAGIITISDLPQRALIEIRDLAGRLVRSAVTITPSYSLDSDAFQEGDYTLLAISQEIREEFQFNIKRHS